MRPIGRETFAQVRARLDAGLDREAVLQDANVDAGIWMREEESLLAELADEVERAEFGHLEDFRSVYQRTWTEVTDIAVSDAPRAAPSSNLNASPRVASDQAPPAALAKARFQVAAHLAMTTHGDILEAQRECVLRAGRNGRSERIPACDTADETRPPWGFPEEAPNPLPFTAQAPASPVGQVVSASADDAGDETPAEAVFAVENPLPFKAALFPRAGALQDGPTRSHFSRPLAAQERSSDSETAPDNLMSVLPSSILPFRSSSTPSALPGMPLNASARPSSERTQDLSHGVAARLTLAQYASLCAEFAVFPHEVVRIAQRYGLGSLHEKRALDLVWHERLGRNATEYHAWQALVPRYEAYWADPAHHDGPR